MRRLAIVVMKNKNGFDLPLVLQMPITSRCNSRCKTCNVWKSDVTIDIDPIALKESLKDPFFSNVQTVGINGGEFTLVPNFIEILDAVLVLPKISRIHLISNGLVPHRLFEYLKTAKDKCKEKNVSLAICISVDGAGVVHENVRGIPNCFGKTKEILDELYKNKENYCDTFSVGCTLSKHNIGYIRETENFFSLYEGLMVEYHLAIPNKRIGTFNDYSDYYVLNDEKSRQLATEFFYEKFRNTNDENKKRQYFSNYYFLKNKGKGRLCRCDYLNRDVTIDQNLGLSLCATASDIIGNLKEANATNIINSKRRKKIHKSLKTKCDTCIHYSYHPLTTKGRWVYIRELLRDKYVFEFYDAIPKSNMRLITRRNLSLTKRYTKDCLKLIYKIIWKSL